MKTFKIFFLATLAGIFACQLSVAQTTRSVASDRNAAVSAPMVTQKYTNNQIEDMLMRGKRANTSDVTPSATLVQRFMSDFPQARDTEWEIGGGVYEVEFEVSNTDYKAYYDAGGELLAYKYDIRRRDIPSNVRTAIDGRHPGYRYDDIEWIRIGNDTYYRVKLERGDEDIKVMVRTDGTIMNNIIL